MAGLEEVERETFERRPAARKRVLLPGLIVYGHEAFTCDCKLRNVSATGARISLAYPLPLPSRFHLIHVKDGIAYSARRVWSRGLDMGVRFDSIVVLSAKPDVVFERLKKLWQAKRGTVRPS